MIISNRDGGCLMLRQCAVIGLLK